MNTTQETAGRTPETPVDKVRDLLAGLIDAVTTQGGRTLDTLGLRPASKPWTPDVDVVESADQVLVLVDLPGIDPAHVEIVLAGNLLTVKGTPVSPPTEADLRVHRRERPAAPFHRTIPLPVSVNGEQVSAESRWGVLTVRLAKEERIKPRQIPIVIHAPAG